MGYLDQPKINKILEIDLDTERETMLYVLQVTDLSYNRSRLPDKDWNVKDNLIICTIATHAGIMQAEQLGIYKKGEAIRRVIDNLQEMYVDSQQKIFDGKLNNLIADKNMQDGAHQYQNPENRLDQLLNSRDYYERRLKEINTLIDSEFPMQ